jgi:hypothetical protein
MSVSRRCLISKPMWGTGRYRTRVLQNREPPVFKPGALFDLTLRFLEFRIWLSTFVFGRGSPIRGGCEVIVEAHIGLRPDARNFYAGEWQARYSSEQAATAIIIALWPTWSGQNFPNSAPVLRTPPRLGRPPGQVWHSPHESGSRAPPQRAIGNPACGHSQARSP